MGIIVEFNPDLCLRNKKEHKYGTRRLEEVIPDDLIIGNECYFLKKG